MTAQSFDSATDFAACRVAATGLLDGFHSSEPKALSRVLKAHPDFNSNVDSSDSACSISDNEREHLSGVIFTIGDAQLTLAREQGYDSWLKLHGALTQHSENPPALAYHEKIQNSVFRRAVDCIDSGNRDNLAALLEKHPDLIHEQVDFNDGSYFSSAGLIEFCAENPVRNDALPQNIVDIVRLLLESGAKNNQESIDVLLQLVCSGRVAREHKVQLPLIALLHEYGAAIDSGLHPAVSHGEIDAANKLLALGANNNLVVAAALGNVEKVSVYLHESTPLQRHHALAQAAQHGAECVVLLLLEQGEDPNRLNPDGSHAHCTPLHQAALAGHKQVVELLVTHGASTNVTDTIHHSKPMVWAEHGGHNDIVEYLQRVDNTDGK